MVIKPIRLFCYMFLLTFVDLCTTFNSIPIILNLLTNRNIVLIYSVTICEQKQSIVQGQGASNINYSTVVFNFDVCWLSLPVSSTNYVETTGVSESSLRQTANVNLYHVTKVSPLFL